LTSKKKRFLFVLFSLVLINCTIDYSINNSNKQTKSKFQKLDCKDEDCPTSQKCVTLSLENCEDDINCTLFRTRNNLQAQCRQLCNMNRQPTTCPTSMRCVYEKNLQAGVCLNGLCDKDNDCGTNNKLTNKCLDNNNGFKSGICALSCDPLQCASNKCPDCPNKLNACEIIGQTNNFICIQPGESASFEPCNIENAFCQPGHFCFQEKCLPYCNIKQNPTTCPANTTCRPFFDGCDVGFCEFITQLP